MYLLSPLFQKAIEKPCKGELKNLRKYQYNYVQRRENKHIGNIIHWLMNFNILMIYIAIWLFQKIIRSDKKEETKAA